MSDSFFGQYLLGKGILSREQFQKFSEMHRKNNQKIGELARQQGFLTSSDIEKIWLLQRKDERLFGKIALDLGLIDAKQLETLLDLQQQQHKNFFQILLESKYLPESVIKHELEQYKVDQEAKKCLFDLAWVENNMQAGKIIATLISQTIRLTRLLGDIDIREGESQFDKKHLDDLDILVSDQLTGEKTFHYLFNATRNIVVAIGKGIMGQQDISFSEELLLDAGREFVNMVCGNAITKLAENRISMQISVPTVQKFKRRYYYRFSSKEEAVVVPCIVPEGAIEIAIVSETLYKRKSN